jgi:hypothetical protein
MSILDIVGWIGSAILVWSLVQTRILRLRVINLVGCIILIVFNTVAGVWPMAGLNIGLAIINVYHLRQLLSSRHSPATYTVTALAPDDPYLVRLVELHGSDIAKFTPEFATRTRRSDEAFLIMREDETVGYVLLHDAGEGTAQIDLDYVTERFRDLTPGEFVFRRSRLLTDRGFSRVKTAPGADVRYYEKIGFVPSGDAFELDLSRA